MGGTVRRQHPATLKRRTVRSLSEGVDPPDERLEETVALVVELHDETGEVRQVGLIVLFGEGSAQIQGTSGRNDLDEFASYNFV